MVVNCINLRYQIKSTLIKNVKENYTNTDYWFYPEIHLNKLQSEELDSFSQNQVKSLSCFQFMDIYNSSVNKG